MNEIRNLAIGLVTVAMAAAGGGYVLGRRHDQAPAPMPASLTGAITPRPAGPPIYYQDPDGKPDYSPTPKRTVDGRDYKPVYEDSQRAATSTQASNAAPANKGKIIYYRNPMGLADTSPVPKKDSMGMDYIPVYESETGSAVVSINPARVQMLGVRTVTVMARPGLLGTIRATGTVQFDERHLATVTTKVSGWVEKLDVAATGEAVRAGQPLLELYAPDIVAAEQEYLVVTGMSAGSQGNMAAGNRELLLDASIRRLRALDVSEAEIARLRRTGETSRRIAVLAPANGIITDKDAVLGMHVDAGTPLYKTADLSSVWLIAQVHEQDLGRIKPGQAAHATLVAFPGRVFSGVVDFVYPDLMADTRTAKVRIVMPNTDRLLRAQMYAAVAIDAQVISSTSTLAVPDSAIIDSGAAQAVLVVKGEGRYEPRNVRVGARGDGYTQILAGLAAGEQVVVSANFLIDAESNLRAALQAFATGASKNPVAPAAGGKP